MFDDPAFQKHDFQHIPLDCDLFVMGGQWMEEYEKAWREVFAGSDRNPAEVGYISYAAARAVRGSVIELSWYANIIDRFHEVRSLLFLKLSSLPALNVETMTTNLASL